MATITNLKLSSSVTDSIWIRNIVDDNATDGVGIVPAIEHYTHSVKSIIITTSVPDKWIKILDGDNILIGPVSLSKYVPLEIVFAEPVLCTVGNPIVLQTEAESDVHIILTGRTLPPPLESPTNPTPEDGATGVSLSPTVSWDSTITVLSSSVYLDDKLNGQTDDGTYIFSNLKPETTYTWFVVDTDGNDSQSGDLWTFTTGTA